MNRKSTPIRTTAAALLSAGLAVFWLVPAAAQSLADAPVYDYDEPAEQLDGDEAYDEDVTVEVVILNEKELTELVGPIALYPDDLLAIVLPASTYPLEIVQAARFLDELEKDSSLEPPGDWDDSVTALLNYPEVVRMMNDDIDWTWKLGGAVLNQQADVIEAVETFRDRAYAAGNLKSDDYQTVKNDGDNIEIIPTSEEIIYVPYYEPRRVVIRQVEPVYYYYPRPCPVYYYPYPSGYSFSNGFFWGVTTAFRIGWSSRHLHVHHHSFWSHPYYGHRYHGHYYRQPSVVVYNNWYVNNSHRHSRHRYRDGDYWRPRPNSGVRPGGHGSHRPDRYNTNGRDDAGNHSGVLAAQTSNTRPVSRPGNRGVDAATRREIADGRRDRHVRGDRPQIRQRSEQSSDKPVRPTKPGNTIRFRDRPRPVTAAARPGQQRDDGALNTVRPQKPAMASVRPKPLRDDSRDRRRTSRERDRDKPAAIGFRERPELLTATTRPGTQHNSANTVRSRTPAGAKPRPATERPSAGLRKPAQRDTHRAYPTSQRRQVTTKPVARRTPAVQREPVRQAKPQVRQEQRRTERKAASRNDRAASGERKDSRKKHQKGSDSRREKRSRR